MLVLLISYTNSGFLMMFTQKRKGTLKEKIVLL